MFAFGPYIPTHSCCANPFGATIANPRINFALGIAAATSMPMMPMYRPYTPVFGFGFAGYTPAYQTPAFGALTGQNYMGYFNQLPPSFKINTNFNTNFNSNIQTNSNNSNPFGYFNNTNSFKVLGYNTAKSTDWVKEVLANHSSRTKTTTSTNSTTTVDNSGTATDGIKLNRNNSEYGPEFLAKVKQIANRLNCNYRDLLGLMNSESGIRADIKNPNGSASGLIQFIESTANSLGTTTAQLRQMSPIDQLDYVEKYLVQAKSRAGITGELSAGDLYSLVFLPGRANRDVLTSSGENYYACNKGLDLNKDGQITKAELGQRVQNKYVSDNSFLA